MLLLWYHHICYGVIISFGSTIISFFWMLLTRPRYPAGGGPVGVAGSMVEGLIKLIIVEIIFTIGSIIASYKYFSLIGLGVLFICKFLQYYIMFNR